ncbi:MAG: hypothetical protein Q9228_006564 [Teloschistes exilis]
MLKTLASVVAIASLAFAVALPANTKQLLTLHDACSSGPHAPIRAIGGSGDHDSCESRIQSTGEVISGLDVWWDKNGIKGILFTYSGGQASMQGSQTGDSKQAIKFNPKERVLAATLWGNGRGKKLGYIYMKTDLQDFDVGMGKKNDGYQINVSSGLLIGAAGITAGASAKGTKDFVAQLALLFLSPNLPDPEHYGKPIGQRRQRVIHCPGIEISGEMAGIGTKATTGATWSLLDTSSKSTLISDEVTLIQIIGPISIEPGHGKACQIFVQKGNGDFPYTSTVTLNLDDGGQIRYQEKGRLLSVQYSQVKSSCVEANDPKDWDVTTDNPPAGVTIVGKSLSRRSRPLPPRPIV